MGTKTSLMGTMLWTISHVLRRKRGEMRRVGSMGRVGGMNQLLTHPAAAMNTAIPPTT